MKLNDDLVEDMTRLASGAASALSGLREQIQARHGFKGPFGATSPTQGSVSREEFEAVAAVAEKARTVQEALLRRIEALEARLGIDNKDAGETVSPGGDEI